MALAFEQSQVHVRTTLISKLELRLMQISEEYNIKYMNGCTKTSQYTNEMNSKVEAIKAQLGDNPSSEEYRQNMAQCESVENEYTMIIQQIQDQMNIAEQKMQTQQEQVETKLEVIRAEKEQWEEALDNTIEKTCGYFNNN